MKILKIVILSISFITMVQCSQNQSQNTFNQILLTSLAVISVQPPSFESNQLLAHLVALQMQQRSATGVPYYPVSGAAFLAKQKLAAIASHLGQPALPDAAAQTLAVPTELAPAAQPEVKSAAESSAASPATSMSTQRSSQSATSMVLSPEQKKVICRCESHFSLFSSYKEHVIKEHLQLPESEFTSRELKMHLNGFLKEGVLETVEFGKLRAKKIQPQKRKKADSLDDLEYKCKTKANNRRFGKIDSNEQQASRFKRKKKAQSAATQSGNGSADAGQKPLSDIQPVSTLQTEALIADTSAAVSSVEQSAASAGDSMPDGMMEFHPQTAQKPSINPTVSDLDLEEWLATIQ